MSNIISMPNRPEIPQFSWREPATQEKYHPKAPNDYLEVPTSSAADVQGHIAEAQRHAVSTGTESVPRTAAQELASKPELHASIAVIGPRLTQYRSWHLDEEQRIAS